MRPFPPRVPHGEGPILARRRPARSRRAGMPARRPRRRRRSRIACPGDPPPGPGPPGSEVRSQILTVASWLAEASFVPSGLNVTLNAGAAWPGKA